MHSPFRVTHPVGTGQSRASDVIRIRRALTETGHGRSPREPSGVYDPSIQQSIKRFQRDNGLKPDAIIKPGGPTEEAIRWELDIRRADRRRAREARERRGEIETAQQRDGGNGSPGAPGRRPGETHVAFGPAALAPLIPPAIHAGRAALGLGAGLAAGQATIDAARRKGANREITEPPPPTPPFPAEAPKLGDRETFPAEPPKLPENKGLPAEGPKVPNRVIFESLEDDTFWKEAMILRRWGSEKTKKLNDRAGKLGVEIGKRLGRRLTMTHGGFDSKGKYQSELHLSAKGELIDPDRPLANGSWPDVVLIDEETKAKILINTADTYAGTGVPKPREERQGEKIMINKKSKDVFIALPKPRGEVDLEEYVKQFEPLLEEVIERLNSQP